MGEKAVFYQWKNCKTTQKHDISRTIFLFYHARVGWHSGGNSCYVRKLYIKKCIVPSQDETTFSQFIYRVICFRWFFMAIKDTKKKDWYIFFYLWDYDGSICTLSPSPFTTKKYISVWYFSPSAKTWNGILRGTGIEWFCRTKKNKMLIVIINISHREKNYLHLIESRLRKVFKCEIIFFLNLCQVILVEIEFEENNQPT